MKNFLKHSLSYRGELDLNTLVESVDSERSEVCNLPLRSSVSALSLSNLYFCHSSVLLNL